MTNKLTIHDVDDRDLEKLGAAAYDRGVSLERYIAGVLHEQAQRERHRRFGSGSSTGAR